MGLYKFTNIHPLDRMLSVVSPRLSWINAWVSQICESYLTELFLQSQFTNRFSELFLWSGFHICNNKEHYGLIPRAKLNPDLCHHMVSVSPIELIFGSRNVTMSQKKHEHKSLEKFPMACFLKPFTPQCDNSPIPHIFYGLETICVELYGLQEQLVQSLVAKYAKLVYHHDFQSPVIRWPISRKGVVPAPVSQWANLTHYPMRLKVYTSSFWCQRMISMTPTKGKIHNFEHICVSENVLYIHILQYCSSSQKKCPHHHIHYDKVNVCKLQGMFPYINQLADVYPDGENMSHIKASIKVHSNGNGWCYPCFWPLFRAM